MHVIIPTQDSAHSYSSAMKIAMSDLFEEQGPWTQNLQDIMKEGEKYIFLLRVNDDELSQLVKILKALNHTPMIVMSPKDQHAPFARFIETQERLSLEEFEGFVAHIRPDLASEASFNTEGARNVADEINPLDDPSGEIDPSVLDSYSDPSDEQ